MTKCLVADWEGEGGLIKYSDVGLEIPLIRQSELPYSGLTVHLCLPGRYFTETKLHISKTRMEILFPWDVFSVCFHQISLEVCRERKEWLRRQEEFKRSSCQNLTYTVPL